MNMEMGIPRVIVHSIKKMKEEFMNDMMYINTQAKE